MTFSRFFTSERSLSILPSLVLWVLAGSPALAEEQPVPPEVHLGVTATTPSRLEEPAEEASGSVSVLTEPEIDAQNPVAITEVLRDLPGVSLQESGTIGESAAFTLRGTEPTQSLILLDGIRLNSPYRGGFDFGGFIVDQVGQVEIVRGPQSALYGSEAMGGVVNLRTRTARGPLGVSLTAAAGNEGTYREVLSVEEKRSRVDYALTFSRTDTAGQFDRDRFGASTFGGEVGLSVRETGRLQLISRFQSDRKELAIDVIPVSADAVQMVFDENDELRKRFFFNSLQYNDRLAPWFDLSWKAAVVDTSLNWDNPPDPGSGNPDSYFETTDTRTLVLDLQQNIFAGDSDTVTFGIERTRDIVNSEITVFDMPFPVDQTRENTAYYVQNLFKWGRPFVLQAGARLDDNNSFGTVTSPKVSSAYEWESTGTRVKGSWGAGFRAPTIQELYFPNFGNPGLEPERSRSWEAGVQQKIVGEALLIDASYFRIDYRDLIQAGPIGVTNIGEAHTQGVESSLKARLHSTLTAQANYTYLDAKDETTWEELPFRPRHQGNIGLLYTPTVNIIANLDINMVSSQAITSDFIQLDGSVLQDRSPGYTRVDLSAAYHLFGGALGIQETRFFIRVKNLFDREYQEVPGFPAPGINFLAGISADL